MSIFGKEINELLIEFYKTNKQIVVGSFGGSIITFTVESIIMPRLMAKLFNNLDDLRLLKQNIIKILIAWTFIQFSYSISEKLNSNVEPALTKFMTDKIIKSMFIKYENNHSKIDTSLLFSKIVLLRTNIEGLVDRMFVILLPRIISVSMIIINFWIFNKKIGMCALIVIVIQFILIFTNMDDCITKSFDEIENKDIKYNELSDKIDNINIISATFNGIEKEIKDSELKSTDIMKDRIATNDCVINKQINGYISNTFVFITILSYTYKLYENGEIDKEVLSTVLLSMNTFFNHMYEITYYIPDITRKLGVLDSNKKFIAELFSYKDKQGEIIKLNSGSIEFKNVSFSYDNANILTDMNIVIADKSLVVLYGPSGSGKSTFVKLINNIETPTKGTILIDGNDVSKIDNNVLKQNITYISQNMSSLFNTTILNNLVYGLTDDNNTETMVKEKIIKLMNKYELYTIYKTINENIKIELNINTNSYENNYLFLNFTVGKGGELISGGQRQMIHIIRAILNNTTKILILDEPTSALDTHTRNNVIEMIKNECKNKTVIIITHDEYVKQISTRIIKFTK